jgi:transposase
LACKLTRILCHAYDPILPTCIKERALGKIAFDPFGYFERGYKDCHISRDADSFFPVSIKSARNSPLPPDHPILATNLTDEQWVVLAPLIPPDPHLDWLTGEPPVIVAASRWGFTQYVSTGWFNDLVTMENYHQVLQRFPALATSSQVASPVKRRGRHCTSPRALLDAIFWKLATGQTWDALPLGFPPLRLCRKYYRRLFLSGRLYTLLLALYNHMRLEAPMYIETLLEAGVFTTTPGQKIALSPQAPPTWENYTALLFMQLARAAYSRLECNYKEKHPLYTLLPVFQGDAQLSTGEIPGLASQEPTPAFQPLEISPAAKKWRKIERDRKTIAREVSKRLRAGNQPASFDLTSFSLDEEFGP